MLRICQPQTPRLFSLFRASRLLSSVADSLNDEDNPDLNHPTAVYCGVDEAGRGALIGPLVVAAVVVDPMQEIRLRKEGVKDSKRLSPSSRERLYHVIHSVATCVQSIHISAEEIDSRRAAGENLNQIELLSMFQLLFRVYKKSTLRPTELRIDALESSATKNGPKDFGERFRPLFPNTQVIAVNRADDLYISAGAASIIAKVERDQAMQILSAELGEDLGTGYPADQKSKLHVFQQMEALEKEGATLPNYIRSSWNVRPLG